MATVAIVLNTTYKLAKQRVCCSALAVASLAYRLGMLCLYIKFCCHNTIFTQIPKHGYIQYLF